MYILGRLTTFVREYPNRHLSQNTLPDLNTTCHPYLYRFSSPNDLCDLSTTVKKTRIFIFFPSCVQIINSSCSRIIVNMNHESFKLLLMTLMMIKLYKITVFTKNTISFYRKNNKKIVIFCRKLRFCFTQNFNSCVVKSTNSFKTTFKEDKCG